jgi:hypothetical protein
MQSSLDYACPAAIVAKSILDVWLSGDQYQLRRELERATTIPPAEYTDQSERLELLQSVALRMSESTELFAPRGANPRVVVWLDLLDHLSSEPPESR